MRSELLSAQGPKSLPVHILAELGRRLIVPAAAALLLAGCGPRAPRSAAPASSDAPQRIETAVAGASPTAGSLLLGGQVHAREEATLRAAIAGRVTQLPLSDGSRFRTGDALVRFDAIEVRGALRSAEARLGAARVRAAEARRQTARFDSLFVRGVVAIRDRDLARQDTQAALAEEADASAGAERLCAGTTIRAPFAGVVGRRLVEPGADVAAGQPLLEVYSNAGEEIAVALPESRASTLASDSFEVQFAETEPWIPAHLVRSEAVLDPATRTRMVYLQPTGGASLSAHAPGSFVRVRATATGVAKRMIMAPASALVRRGGLTGVFVVRDGRAWLRWVRPGAVRADEVEIAAGLDPGETFAQSAEGLSDGARVKTRP